MHHVYILLNEAKSKTYTGVTNDIQRRLKEHNQGKVAFSRKFVPYTILHTEEFLTASEAYATEKFYKSTSGRRIIKKYILEIGESAKITK